MADGFVPYLFAEGAYNSRLEAIADVPKGKDALAVSTAPTCTEAKEVLGGIACIQGNVPEHLLQLGSVEEVKDYCRDLLQTVAPGGGFIPGCGRGGGRQPRTRTCMAMIDSVRT